MRSIARLNFVEALETCVLCVGFSGVVHGRRSLRRFRLVGGGGLCCDDLSQKAWRVPFGLVCVRKKKAVVHIMSLTRHAAAQERELSKISRFGLVEIGKESREIAASRMPHSPSLKFSVEQQPPLFDLNCSCSCSCNVTPASPPLDRKKAT